MKKLLKKNVIITGAGAGIGQAIAIEFAKQGANLLLNDIDSLGIEWLAKDLQENYRVRVKTFQADVANSTEVANMYDFFDKSFNSLDIIVNNAGFAQERSITEMTDDDWDRMIRVHLYGTFYNCREAAKRMVELRKGKIINLASDLGMLGAEYFAHYAASKGGIISLTKSLARELAPYILVNGIAPAATWTTIINEFGEGYEEKEAAKYPLKRFGQPEEIAKTALFLASDDSAFYTGQILCPNGGVVMNG
ncbi:SDR family NAD(P)-dependent oxidoreductase [Massilibacterium senegalense]|uniref:SDR family NAD(P)-dependent oxidoreductase n=1 Tax=Massilibacterium senegalense TaxID=1632858 RepID=UPI00078420E9|nr:SDR family oxidoreductase [Massilibacterium senegalense]